MTDTETKHLYINGKFYPLWEKFVFQKSDMIGAPIEDLDAMDMGDGEAKSRVSDVHLEPNGKDSAILVFKTVDGWDAACDVKYLSVGGAGEPGWLHFYGYGGWHIRVGQKPKIVNNQ